LLEQIERSVLGEAVVDAKVIRLGLDLGLFYPDDKELAKARLRLPNRPVILFAANRAKSNPFKGWRTAYEVIQQLADEDPVTVICVGDHGRKERIGNVEVRYVGQVAEPASMADWYRAADRYLHTARADNSPLALMEAQACGTPGIACAVGGIPELVVSAGGEGTVDPRHQTHVGKATGFIATSGTPSALAAVIRILLAEVDLRGVMSANAAAFAKRMFSIARYVRETLDWYETICNDAA
jgi:glycosyltransferase involved in cell wall biosynthesis